MSDHPPFTILHTEASPGWGGQEIRTLQEALGMQKRGHKVVLAVQKGGGLVAPAKRAGLITYEIPFSKPRVPIALCMLLKIIMREKIHIINTHSSLDAWLGGILAKILRKKVIRTRHLSTPIRPGLNRFLLYQLLTDKIVTTCEETASLLRKEMGFASSRCLSIPTGVDPQALLFDPEKVKEFRASLGIKPGECLAGTLAVMRGWKGISDLLLAAKSLQDYPELKWLVIGGGVSENYFRQQWRDLGLENRVIFLGHLDSPFIALAALDIFLLLSFANEGVSQASLQAAFLQKPLITTPIGGLPEVCIPGETGLLVPPKSPEEVALAVKRLVQNPLLRQSMGKKAQELVKDRFLFSHTLDNIEKLYSTLR